jgi:uncharacterized integral membrane protein
MVSPASVRSPQDSGPPGGYTELKVRMLSLFETLLAILLGVVFTLLALQNAQPVNLTAYGYHFDGVPLYAVILTAGVLGAAPLLCIGLIRGWRSRYHMRKLRKRLGEREGRVNQLEEEVLRLRGAA